MKTGYTRADPTPVIVDAMTPSSGTASYRSLQCVFIPIVASTTGTAHAWINPELGTVAARVHYYFTTAGTGTVDVGVATDGTASATNIIRAGTMIAAVAGSSAGGIYSHGTVASTLPAGQIGEIHLVSQSGTAGDSITFFHNESNTSTGVGGMLIEYYFLGTTV